MVSVPSPPVELVPEQAREPALARWPGTRPSRLASRCGAVLATWPARAGALFVTALVLRLVEIRRSYDIFVDEVSYTNIANNLAHGAGLALYGKPFDLHPPAAFALYATAIAVLGLHGGVERLLFDLRPVAAVAGSVVPVAIFALVYCCRPRRWAAGLAGLAGLMVALDPIAQLYDSRVMLEPVAQSAAAGMFALLAAACAGGSERARRWALGLAGLLGAVVLSTKETFGLVVVLALAVLVVTGWALPRREASVVAAMTLTGYGISVAATVLSTGFAPWWNTQVTDVLRGVGANQETGFNAPSTHVTLLSRFLADLPELGVTYVVLALGTMAAAALVWRLRPWSAGAAGGRGRGSATARDRATLLLGIWALSAAAYLVYATLFGTIEEQMYYILLAPAAASLVVWLAGPLVSARTAVRAAATAVVCLAVLFDGASWTVVHTRTDDEYAALVSWEVRHLPVGSVVSATDGTSQFLLQDVVIGQWATVGELRRHHVGYVVVATSLVDQGYGIASSQFLRTIEHKGEPVFVTRGPSDGDLEVYDVKALTGGDAARGDAARKAVAGQAVAGQAVAAGAGSK
jgi:hypothetical protein